MLLMLLPVSGETTGTGTCTDAAASGMMLQPLTLLLLADATATDAATSGRQYRQQQQQAGGMRPDAEMERNMRQQRESSSVLTTCTQCIIG